MANEKTPLTLRQKLSKIQTELKAPKNLYNKFGGYNYRNVEGICEAVKPYEKEYNVAFLLEDTPIQVGDRYYIMASATMMDCESNDSITATAYAREAIDKKGMDDSQITGTASSYARKYALNGLLLLDDTKDADTDEYHEQQNNASAPEKTLEQLLKEKKIPVDFPAKAFYNCESFDQLSDAQKQACKNNIAKIETKYKESLKEKKQ